MKKTTPIMAMLIAIMVLTLVTSLANAITWSSETQLTSHTFWDGFPSVTQASNGSILVLWTSDRNGMPGENWDILYKTYSGSSWSPDKVLIGGSPQDITPSVLTAANGTLWLVWASDRSGNYDIFFKTSSNNGATWSVERLLSQNAENDLAPSIGQAADGTIWVVWYREFSLLYYTEIFYRKYSPQTHSWSPERQLTNLQTNTGLSSVVQASNGTIWIVYESYQGEEFDIFAVTSSDNGATWSPQKQLTTTTDVDTDPAMCRTIFGNLWMVWSAKKPSGTATNDLYYITSSDNGASWSSPIQATVDKYDDVYPSIIQSRDRKMWIVWTSDRVGQPNASLEIFYKTTIPIRGDINEDWVVNLTDLALVSKAYGTHKGEDPGYNPATDLNNDDYVDLVDLTLLAKNWGKTG